LAKTISKIIVSNTEIAVTNTNNEDCISLTEMAEHALESYISKNI
jgi:hypothetical protein